MPASDGKNIRDRICELSDVTVRYRLPRALIPQLTSFQAGGGS